MKKLQIDGCDDEICRIGRKNDEIRRIGRKNDEIRRIRHESH